MRKLYSIGLVRGLLWQIFGTAIGIGILTGIRFLLGLAPWKAESAFVFGALLGALFFLYGIGAVDDWIKVDLLGKRSTRLMNQAGEACATLGSHLTIR